MVKNKKQGRGRPRIFKGDSVRVGCLAPVVEVQKWRKIADRLEIDFSKFMREALQDYADKLSGTS